MEVRTGSTNADQYWRVTGIQEGDAPSGVALPKHVVLEAWVKVELHGSNGKTYKDWHREILSFDPDYARQVGQHLIDLANHAEETAVSNASIGPEEIEHRFGFHKATIEGDGATLPVHRELRIQYREFASILDRLLPPGRAKDQALKNLENASMWAHKSVAELAPLIEE
jgi:hypothetical protein